MVVMIDGPSRGTTRTGIGVGLDSGPRIAEVEGKGEDEGAEDSRGSSMNEIYITTDA